MDYVAAHSDKQASRNIGKSTLMTIKARPCHVCAGTSRNVLYHQQFSGLSSGSFLPGYNVCVCGDCGLAFADELPPPESFDRYYAEMSKWEFLDNDGKESEQDARRFAATADFLETVGVRRESPVLDIGCATCGMLAVMKKRGYAQLLGIDPSPKCAELARKTHGIEVFTGPVKELKQLPKNFEIVLMSGVLEHLYDPNAVLRDIRDRMTDDGLLYVSVPDATRFASYMDAPFQQFSLEHVLFFTPASLINLLRINGFQLVKTRLTAYPYTLRYLYPGVEGVFKKSTPASWTRDESGDRGLKEYIQASAVWEKKIISQIADLVDRQEPLLVWGVGTNMQRLLASTRLGEANIVAFVDSNPHYHGKQLAGRPIIPPQNVSEHDESILIGSIIYRDEIAGQIRDDLKCANRLLLLGAE